MDTAEHGQTPADRSPLAYTLHAADRLTMELGPCFALELVVRNLVHMNNSRFNITQCTYKDTVTTPYLTMNYSSFLSAYRSHTQPTLPTSNSPHTTHSTQPTPHTPQYVPTPGPERRLVTNYLGTCAGIQELLASTSPLEKGQTGSHICPADLPEWHARLADETSAWT